MYFVKSESTQRLSGWRSREC